MEATATWCAVRRASLRPRHSHTLRRGKSYEGGNQGTSFRALCLRSRTEEDSQQQEMCQAARSLPHSIPKGLQLPHSLRTLQESWAEPAAEEPKTSRAGGGMRPRKGQSQTWGLLWASSAHPTRASCQPLCWQQSILSFAGLFAPPLLQGMAWMVPHRLPGLGCSPSSPLSLAFP